MTKTGGTLNTALRMAAISTVMLLLLFVIMGTMYCVFALMNEVWAFLTGGMFLLLGIWTYQNNIKGCMTNSQLADGLLATFLQFIVFAVFYIVTIIISDAIGSTISNSLGWIVFAIALPTVMIGFKNHFLTQLRSN